ncbi:pyruvate, phosphate dikinase [Sediminispirochaeta smaragdinae]|jgi:pyruvate,orthophosphate dikinase|uniref:Pyruvate, phosphate dikinase n=1 Tax=Sediminispirochaeta smaragdinae (strain DSM 11293 / JCM 15392 / SEBR 4228) TaxID=573413 RepID=E1R678_SEDSS|nr:pyruvate, phosphate dikinase [Sediminispirochaeta smaragdinae]ADK80843.1 pyruvate, phosphate dikinase [Sediminispirochaeta smaragdinae DSM 11293]
MAKTKMIYFFGDGKAEGNAKMKDLLGGKGANLAEMTSIGVPVPPGFTISTEVCSAFYENKRSYPAGFASELKEHLGSLEKLMGKKLGDANDPLLVSVRSGAAISMPGMMDTILNLGLNDQATVGLGEKTGNPRFAWDAYRRFIQMFSNVAMGMKGEVFEAILEKIKADKKVELDTELDADDLQKVVTEYKKAYKKHMKSDFPQDPVEQLQKAIDAVFGSWMNDRAIHYRKLNNITGLLGTAVNVQSMVFGNFGDDSGTGVCFSRDPSTGKKVFYGEFLMNAQGEDVVAGIRTPEKLSSLKKRNAAVYDELEAIKDKLENHYHDMQDIEFTIQQGKLFLLQTRNGKRTGPAAVKIAVDMVAEKMITEEEAIGRVSPDQLDQLFHPGIDPKMKKSLSPLAKGLNASPGAATGQIVFSAEDAEAWAKDGKKVLLVRKETSPEDIGGMVAAQGVLTSTGGMTSHAAVVARGMGKPCVAGCKSVVVSGKAMSVDGKKFKEGAYLSIDGSTGEVFEGELELVSPKITKDLATFLGWADKVRLSAKREGIAGVGFQVRTNADQPADAKVARKFGAEGIGLCRTEHMFFDEGKLEIFQEMIISETAEARADALKKLLPLQKKDFKGIFTAMEGLPVTIRLLDPPLHEFVPKTAAEVKELAAKLGIKPAQLKAKAEALKELNPMLGHRGCRLGITYPEIYDMQVEAIMTAACEVQKSGKKVHPEIMIPLIGTVKELQMLRANAEAVIEKVLSQKKMKVDYKIGTMIEIPRAALTADKVAASADFFSFGTNDLTQMTFGYSRDDIGSFIGDYLDQGVLPRDPFQSLDTEGVGQLVSMGVEKGRSVKGDLKMGICGEHGGDPDSIDFCYRTGLNYVSCSPYRVPIARLAAAQAVARSKK